MNPATLKQLQEAYSAFQAGRYDHAALGFDRVLQAEPNNVDALHLAGATAQRQGRFTDSRRFLELALSVSPKNAEIRNRLGIVLKALDRPFSAVQAYQHAIEASPTYKPARLNLTRLLTSLGEVERGATEAKTLLKAGGGVDATLALADAKAADQDFSGALALYDAVLDARPDDTLAKLKRVDALISDHQYDTAKAALADPGLPQAETGYFSAVLAFETGDAVVAIQTLKALFDANGDARAFKLLLRISFVTGDVEGFRSLLHRAVAEAEAHPAIAVLAIDQMCVSDDVEGAIQLFETLPSHVQASAQTVKAGILEEQGENLAEAVRLAKDALSLNDEDEAAAMRAVRALLRLGEAEDALDIIRIWRDRRPVDQFWLGYETTALRAMGDPEYRRLCDYDSFVRMFRLPTPDGWPSLDAFNSDLDDALKALRPYRDTPLDQSFRNGSQTARSLISERDRTVKAYFEALDAPIRQYIADIGTNPDHPFTARNRGTYRLQGCWSVELGAGGRHNNHVHPQGWISSAYYVVTPTSDDVRHNQDGWIGFGQPPIPVPGCEATERLIEPKAGYLVMFPSYFWHGTRPIDGTERRVTAPFDLAPGTS